MKTLKKTLNGLVVAVAMLVSHQASSMPTIFTDEASYLSAISTYTNVSEGFEGAPWTSCETGCASVFDDGLTWTASDSVRVGSGWVRTGTYGIFDSVGDPDTIGSVNSTDTLFGVGGWFRGSDATNIIFEIDGLEVLNESLLTTHSFFGVVDVAGFNSATFSTNSGHWGADDFTFARGDATVPEPGTLALISLGLFGLGFNRRKRLQ